MNGANINRYSDKGHHIKNVTLSDFYIKVGTVYYRDRERWIQTGVERNRQELIERDIHNNRQKPTERSETYAETDRAGQ